MTNLGLHIFGLASIFKSRQFISCLFGMLSWHGILTSAVCIHRRTLAIWNYALKKEGICLPSKQFDIQKKGPLSHAYIYKMSPADNWNEYASEMDGVLFGILVFFCLYHGAIFCYSLPWYRLIFYIFNNKYAALHWFVSYFFLFDSISEIDEIATVTRKRPVSLWNQ